MKKILKRTGKIFCLFLLIVVLVNILSPLFCRKPDEKYVESLRKTEFTSETAGVERICCIDDNEEALLWRLRMIGTAKESIVLSTFDLRADDNGTKILAALNCAAARGVKIQLLIDGIYQQLFLAGSSDFQALASYENMEVGVYNPVTPGNLFKVNYRMHDKYLIADGKIYILGGRNTYNYFLGDFPGHKNFDRDVLVVCDEPQKDNSVNQLWNYFETIWEQEDCRYFHNSKKLADRQSVKKAVLELQEGHQQYFEVNKEKICDTDYADETFETEKIILLSNPIHTQAKEPVVWYQLGEYATGSTRSRAGDDSRHVLGRSDTEKLF